MPSMRLLPSSSWAHLAVKLELLGEVLLELPAANDIPGASKKLAHSGLTRC